LRGGLRIRLQRRRQPLRRARPPRVGEQLRELVAVDGAEADEDARVAVVVRDREELLGFGADEEVLLALVRAPDDEDAGLADPREQAVLHAEAGRAVRGALLGLRKGQRDGPDVVLARHGAILAGARARSYGGQPNVNANPEIPGAKRSVRWCCSSRGSDTSV